MKIYYAASIWGAAGDAEFNKVLIEHLKNHGTVLSEHLFTDSYKTAEHLNLAQIHNRDLSWVREADVIIAEVSAPSLGVGYELREAVNLGKKILALWKKHDGKRISAMIGGSPTIEVVEYTTLQEIQHTLDSFFEKLKVI